MPNFYKIFLSFLLLAAIISCKNEPKKSVETKAASKKEQSIKYAKGFEIKTFEGYKTITLKNPWPGTEKTFKYALVEKNGSLPNNESFDAVVKIPVKRIVVTSTTHIPSLEMLNETEALVGFPNLNYISSEKTRERISEGKITELGRNEDINTEILINLKPDAVIGFAVDGNNSTFATIEKTGIPVLYNSDWTETSPLGKAEWIKFFGALFNKEEEADSIFKLIETEYLSAKKIASEAKKTPTVISGAMYKDVWYMPQGESWGAKFIADANGDYLWKDSKGTGGLSLSLESVLNEGHNAEVWIGPGQFTSLNEMKSADQAYTQFAAFKTGNVYSYSLKKGETGGVIYFELAPNRPDLVLKDLIKILHPELYPNHELYFFDKIQ
ncbi:ABC-type Fe3+-hydroxamate transport system, periplasmic component [Aequorivita sublithincola DSM 14238]|uniref:ABC-type Fe3+-hydroxamate transport system, periplasmic component n=1 Tax=Aequorivita sublithincola (strain DSM 14238 / LMG 21431 / ACAM 643 / 9-3) TaxID=746697 RepID=I3YZM3_AEQSU|nr:ABC transporter substrate-binding protein [Aequorivita sublithincola]AFL82441.1 ABC-type Fe3+-hydroxamate transport system, periplasmic component [Aequorivita sublithincola DSM 14238]